MENLLAFECPHCHRRYLGLPKHRELIVTCPGCKKTFRGKWGRGGLFFKNKIETPSPMPMYPVLVEDDPELRELREQLVQERRRLWELERKRKLEPGYKEKKKSPWDGAFWEVTKVILFGIIVLAFFVWLVSRGCEPSAKDVKKQEATGQKSIGQKEKERIKQEAIERTKQDLYAKGRKVQTANRSMDTANSLSNVRVNIHPQRDTGGCSVFVYGDVTAFGETHQIRWCYLITENGEWVTVSTYMGPK